MQATETESGERKTHKSFRKTVRQIAVPEKLGSLRSVGLSIEGPQIPALWDFLELGSAITSLRCGLSPRCEFLKKNLTGCVGSCAHPPPIRVMHRDRAFLLPEGLQTFTAKRVGLQELPEGVLQLSRVSAESV